MALPHCSILGCTIRLRPLHTIHRHRSHRTALTQHITRPSRQPTSHHTSRSGSRSMSAAARLPSRCWLSLSSSRVKSARTRRSSTFAGHGSCRPFRIASCEFRHTMTYHKGTMSDRDAGSIYAGSERRKHPPFALCVTQAAMIHGAPPMSITAGLLLVIHVRPRLLPI
jgi:hypothetical protein